MRPEGMSWFPVTPHPYRNMTSEKILLLARKGSLDILHPRPAAGKVPHWWPGASRDEPSLRSVKLATYLSAKL